MYDELFKKYGKVVYKRNDQKSPSAEVDDDAECLAFAVALAKIASDVKAAEIKLLFVKPLVYWTKFFLITTAFSQPQIDAIRTRINALAKKQYGKFATGDTKADSWTLLDFDAYKPRPGVQVNKNNRSMVPKVDSSDRALASGDKFITKSVLRKVAHIQKRKTLSPPTPLTFTRHANLVTLQT